MLNKGDHNSSTSYAFQKIVFEQIQLTTYTCSVLCHDFDYAINDADEDGVECVTWILPERTIVLWRTQAPDDNRSLMIEPVT